MKEYKILFVGDWLSGKNPVMESFITNKPIDEADPNHYSYPTYYDFSLDVAMDSETYHLKLTDVRVDCYERLRPLAYPGTDAFVYCFSTCYRDSFDNLEEKWYPEVQHFCPEVPFIVMGAQIEQRKETEPDQAVSTEEASAWAVKYGAEAYIECSAKTMEGVRDVFEAAVKAAKLPRKKLKTTRLKCIVV
ncbi:P-loop containing nucleoside triphosphate hydrolase protein [Sistotremastrum niveocremeum HHB9708]|uniref:p-loop containing nucleoside triphosphate hydrolase protein n=1 Tax=Sistotremastrum niveocremeum HHB9708 TaxID=1314777 RepID=A0A165AE16_9AGAM|nr:P-loop containing nucleoside triphosphate hydrolase protein [Sistotremastrum niveocremeum HHB9708]